MKTQKSVNFSGLMRACWNSLAGERTAFWIFVVFFVLAYSTDLLIPWAIGAAISAFVRAGFTDAAYHDALTALLFYLGLRLASIVLHHSGRYLQYSVAYCARMRSLDSVFTALVRYRLNWHVARHSGENLAKLNRSTMAVKSMVGQYSWQVLEGSIKVLLAGAALFALDFWVALNVALMGAITLFVMIYFNGRVTATLKRSNAFDNKVNRICLDYLSNIVTVKALGLETVAEDYLKAQKNEGLRCSKAFSLFSELKWGVINIGYAVVISSSLMIYFWLRRGSAGPVDVAQVYVLISYLDKIFQSISSFTAYFGNIVEAATAYDDAVNIIEGSPVSQDPQPAAHPPLGSSWRSLCLRRLGFVYDDEGGAQLSASSLIIRRGERLALIGASGCGKSTLLKLLGGALVPAEADFRTDAGQAVTALELSQHCLLIPQEPQVFAETFLYNLTMGVHLECKRLNEVIRLCRLDSVIERLPQGLQTNLSESGLNLSGGERQRIAIARALFRAGERDIILLDEPTSSLDPQTERELLTGIFAAYSGQTIISSCHRWSLLPLFDRVIHLDNGRVLRQGVPQDYAPLDIGPPQPEERPDEPVPALSFG